MEKKYPDFTQQIAPTQEAQYIPIMQNNETSALRTLNKKIVPVKREKKNEKTEQEYEIATLEVLSVEVFVREFNTKRFLVTTKQVLDIFNTHFALQLQPIKEKGKNITPAQVEKLRAQSITIKEYMSLHKTKDYKRAVQQLTDAYRELAGIAFTGRIWNSDKRKYINVRIPVLSAFEEPVDINNPIADGKLSVMFDYDYVKCISKAYVMPYPAGAIAIPSKTKAPAYYFLNTIATHHNLNAGKKNSNTISVKTLLNRCPAIPKYEEIKETGRIYQRIVNPFTENLEYLVDAGELIEYTIIHKRGAPLSDQELKHLDYATLIECNVNFILPKSYPEQVVLDAKIKTKKKIDKAVAKKERQAEQHKTTQTIIKALKEAGVKVDNNQ